MPGGHLWTSPRSRLHFLKSLLPQPVGDAKFDRKSMMANHGNWRSLIRGSKNSW